jgi:GTP-binding protein
MIIDDVIIKLKAGDGGKGIAVFSRTKGLKGPTGGNGGNGGSIYFEGISDLTALRQFRFRKDIKAEKGENGKASLNDGHNAEDLTLLVPVGTVCKNLTTHKEIEITKVGQRELVARGGKGGRGNFLFRSSTNTSPMEFEEGKDGQFFEFQLELKMIADVGFIGFPNVGKSSLLNELTASKSKVANYTFTTLEPNLGAYYDLILADIPGLIEGASVGKGLGIKFLKHIERTKVLFHFVSADSENHFLDYQKVREELKVYNEALLEKPEYIFLSKSDMVEKEKIAKIIDDFKKQNKEIIPISIIDLESLEIVKNLLNKISKEKGMMTE